MKAISTKVLAALELDARTPFSVIGKQLRKSQQQVSYTVNNLLEKGVLQQFYTIIDYSKLGVLQFRVYFRLTYLVEKKFEELLSYLTHEPHTRLVQTCGGKYDLICTFYAQNPSQFNKTLRATMERFPDQLGNYAVLTTVVTRHFGRKYLFVRPNLSQLFYGGDRAPEEIDDTDLRLLAALSTDARQSAVKLANELDVTPKTVIERIKRLRERKLILGFKPLIEMEKTGSFSTLLLVKYHNISTETEKKLISFLKVHPNIIGLVKTLGEWDIEIEVVVTDQRGLREVEMEIRRRFASLIQNIESIPLYDCLKKDFFPRFLLEN